MQTPENVSAILEAWPAIEEDLKSFLSDTDCWLIDNLEAAVRASDWAKVEKVIGVMKTVHAINHAHH